MNYSRKIYNALAILVIIIAISSCKDTDIMNSNNSLKQNTVQGNQLNPYDNYGIMHNEILDQFLTYRDILSSSCEYSEFINNFNNSVVNSACIVFSDSSYLFKNEITEVLQFYQDSISRLTLQELLNDYGNTDFSAEVNSLLAFLDGSLDIESLQDEIVAWENNVLNNQIFNAEQKKVLLMAGSIARHSSYYWYEVHNNYDSEWYYHFDCQAKSKLENSTLAFEKIAKASLAAALKYGIAGLILGNPVTLIGATAASASVDAATAIDVYWTEIIGAVSSAINWLKGLFI